jgi:hypothetical protein
MFTPNEPIETKLEINIEYFSFHNEIYVRGASQHPNQQVILAELTKANYKVVQDRGDSYCISDLTDPDRLIKELKQAYGI